MAAIGGAKAAEELDGTGMSTSSMVDRKSKIRMPPMIQLDEYSPILRSAFLERLSGPLVERPLDIKAGDFDGSETLNSVGFGCTDATQPSTFNVRLPLVISVFVFAVQYRLLVNPENLGTLYFCIHVPCIDQLRPYGLDDALKAAYGDLVQARNYETADVTLAIPCGDPTVLPEKPAVLAKSLAKARQVIMGAPIRQALLELREGKASKPRRIADRPATGEVLWIVPGKSRCTVIYQLRFEDRMDRAMARVIAQELVAVVDKLPGSPAYLFTEPGTGVPKELEGTAVEHLPEGTGFMSVTLFPTHIDDDSKLDRAVCRLSQFRAFLLYHMKSAKTYLQVRMRHRLKGFQQVLNRAKTSDPFAKKVAAADKPKSGGAASGGAGSS